MSTFEHKLIVESLTRRAFDSQPILIPITMDLEVLLTAAEIVDRRTDTDKPKVSQEQRDVLAKVNPLVEDTQANDSNSIEIDISDGQNGPTSSGFKVSSFKMNLPKLQPPPKALPSEELESDSEEKRQQLKVKEKKRQQVNVKGKKRRDVIRDSLEQLKEQFPPDYCLSQRQTQVNVIRDGIRYIGELRRRAAGVENELAEEQLEQNRLKMRLAELALRLGPGKPLK